jgi:hypothetical protein
MAAAEAHVSNCCFIVNRGRGSSQAVTSLVRAKSILSCPFIIPCVSPTDLSQKGCIVTIYHYNQIQVSCARGWITPNFDCAVSTGSDQFSSLRGVMFRPCYDFMVHLRGRIWFERFCLRQEKLILMSLVCMKIRELTSRRSQAQMAPFSSPATTLASPCPKQARQRYEEWTWPEKSLSSFPVIASMRRMCPSSVITR